MQEGLKAVGKTRSWEPPVRGGSTIRNPNCSLMPGAYCLLPSRGQAHGGQWSLGKGLSAFRRGNKVLEGGGDK